MKLSKAIFYSLMALALSFVVEAAHAQQFPPVWTDVMNAVNDSNAASGNYFPLGSTTQHNIFNTDLASLPTPNTLTLAANVRTLPDPGQYSWTCGNATEPVTFLESNQGSGITGVGFEGSFNDSMGTPGLSGNLFESVFFNENQCYGPNGLGGRDEPNANGREYGFFLATSNNSIWAYWGAMENVNTVQVQMQLDSASNAQTPQFAATPIAGQEYFFEMYPGPASCTFTISVFTTFNTVNPIFTANVPMNGNGNTVTNSGTPLMTADPNFCGAIASETGYVSANVNPSGVTGALPSGGLSLFMQRVFVGKL